MATYCNGKSSWPELVGINGEAAVAIIMRENPRVVRAGTFREGSRMTTDFRCDRVRVWVDDHDIVTSVPKIG
ncbi:Glu S.griseus protease inhibitor [Morella rubra]|uniref:Glu S.griseus protease inhibitor n=1 Tax=Morella rubra TaxID=262757 RepID=A0A6A1W477_9ROSI|nr:Glu S.griseus protease inhibitor [Morella rubra]